ncbi:hypothetical protein KORDIASMS9_00229 [Kordia sp. SMS9]|uniref:hypothetical protein n=1 Tax=Kordia sp. SMS9 TaxID=2282170 RepID=UPI000E104D39|nr:hypothetical protein [Kordia sp. SMS9]AXG68040.1 hypothetical protein KORDIASMS9_00229 [Kordia sp. SMS9]
MRFIKILLIISSLIVMGVAIYIVMYELSRYNLSQLPLSLYFHMSFAFISAAINIIFHVRSFQYYKRKENVRLHKKIHKILWVGAICFAAFLIYVGGVTLYSLILLIEYGYNGQQLLVIFLFIIGGCLGFLEASILKKRMRRLRSENNTMDEIDNIGKEVDY